MSAVSPTGQMYCTAFRESFTTRVFIDFLDRLARSFERKIHLVVDGHSVHRSKAIRDPAAKRADRIELHLLPPYSPRSSTPTSWSMPISNGTWPTA